MKQKFINLLNTYSVGISFELTITEYNRIYILYYIVLYCVIFFSLESEKWNGENKKK